MANNMIRIGHVDIVSVADAVIDHPLELDHIFPDVTPADWEPYRQHYPPAFGGSNVWRVQFGGYLVRSQRRTIVVDTGLGPAGALVGAYLPTPIHVQPPAHLLENLQHAGASPDEVDTVVLTHLHADHAGWNLESAGNDKWLTFKRARYLIHQADWDAFTLRPERFPWVDHTVSPLQALGALDLTSTDRTLTPEVSTLHTPGHTPGHMSVLIASAGQYALIGGDVVVHPAQVTEPRWRFAADMDAQRACTTRQDILDRIEAEGMTVAARHFPEPGFGRVIRLEGRRYWQAV
jgi:glyoxylase-like metal-dependent hydrolase (beta-lactamase superfamily II)